MYFPPLRQRHWGLTVLLCKTAKTHRAGARWRLAVVLAAVCAILAFSQQPAAAVGEPTVSVVRLGNGLYRIQAHALVRATHETIWGTLTAYEDFAQFIPGLNASHVVSRSGARSVVHQQWGVSILWFHYPLDITVLSIERSPSVLEVHRISGDLKQLDGGYLIEEAPDGRFSIVWDGLIEDATIVPDIFSTAIIRNQAQMQFRGMLREIERRSAQSAQARALSP